MPIKAGKQLTIAFSVQQLALIEQMASDLLGPDVKSFTWPHAVRSLIAAYAVEHGYKWTDGVGQWGGLRKGAFGNEENQDK